MKHTYRLLVYLLLCLLGVSTTGCVTMMPLNSSEEGFLSFSKITESPDVACPFGGDDNGPLFFVYQANGMGQANIYKKDKPTLGTMTQMTNVSSALFPTYCRIIDKIAFIKDDDIYVMPSSKGKAMTQITSTPNKESHPCFSSDGKYLVYDRISSFQGIYSTSNSEIWMKNLETGENTMIGKGWSPSFSPDGQKIAYCKAENNTAAIWIMDIDGENQTKLVDNNTLRSMQRPRFSPDGKYIVFDATDKKNNMDIYIVTTEGENLIRLTYNRSNDSQPYWATDGYIYFVSDRGEKIQHTNLWRFRYNPQ